MSEWIGADERLLRVEWNEPCRRGGEGVSDDMWLWYKKERRFVRVYDIQYDKNGYPKFLVFVDGRWQMVSAKHFKPNADHWKVEEPT